MMVGVLPLEALILPETAERGHIACNGRKKMKMMMMMDSMIDNHPRIYLDARD